MCLQIGVENPFFSYVHITTFLPPSDSHLICVCHTKDVSAVILDLNTCVVQTLRHVEHVWLKSLVLY